MDATSKPHGDRNGIATVPMHVRLTVEVKQAIERLARSDGMTVTAWVTTMAKREAKKRGLMDKAA